VTALAGWMVRAGLAARLAGNRADLWIPGAASALAYLAWLPLLAVVAGPPRTSDFAFVGAGLFSSSAYPWNVLLLAAAATLLVLVAFLIAALGEAALLRGLRHDGGGGSLTHDTGVIFTVLLVAALPAAIAVAILVAATVAIAPGEFGAPDLGGPLLARILGPLAPFVLFLAATILLGQAVGAAAIRRAVGTGSQRIAEALRDGVRDVLRRPTRRLGLALTGTLAELLAVGLAFALLRILWEPVAEDLAAGWLLSPATLSLLVGFVAVWLALLLIAGALHAWVSTWWSAELAPGPAEVPPQSGGADAADR